MKAAVFVRVMQGTKKSCNSLFFFFRGESFIKISDTCRNSKKKKGIVISYPNVFLLLPRLNIATEGFHVSAASFYLQQQFLFQLRRVRFGVGLLVAARFGGSSGVARWLGVVAIEIAARCRRSRAAVDPRLGGGGGRGVDLQLLSDGGGEGGVASQESDGEPSAVGDHRWT